MKEVARDHEIVAFIRAGPPPTALRAGVRRLAELARRRKPEPLDDFCRSNGIRRLWMRSRDDPTIAALVQDLRPDLICIASFRWILPPEIAASTPLGAVNLHGSLLPRHRGAVPLFWIFLCDDRETGVTVHRVERDVDAGAILGQDRWPLARGTTADELDATNAARGARLLRRVLEQIAAGEARDIPQDEARVTRAPIPPRSGRFIDFESWPAERVWHFLHAVHPYYTEQIGASYSAVLGWENTVHTTSPGCAVRREGELILHCRDGIVRLRPEARR